MGDTGQVLKTIADSLKSLSKEINSIATQVGKATKLQAKTIAKRKPVKKATKKTTPKKSAPTSKRSVSITDTVYGAIKDADSGIANASIIEKTGLTQKQVANVVLKLKKQGKIKSIGRGVFAGA